MADLVHGIALLVIAGMGAFNVRYRLRQLVFQRRVVLVHPQQVRILRGVGAVSYTHLDVYKRQDAANTNCTNIFLFSFQNSHRIKLSNPLTPCYLFEVVL